MRVKDKTADIDEVVHILTEVVKERGEADEELLNQFAEGPGRARISIETTNLKSYSVEWAVRDSLSDPIRAAVLASYNTKWDEWGEGKPIQSQLRNQMIAARKTYELAVQQCSGTPEITRVVGDIFGALCREDIEDSEPTGQELELRRYGATIFTLIVTHTGDFLGSLRIQT